MSRMSGQVFAICFASVLAGTLLNGSPLSAADATTSRQPVVAPRPLPWDPVSSYEKKDVRGWTVLVDFELRDQHSQLCADALELLNHKLYQMERVLPEHVIKKLRTVSIWLEYNEPAHPCAVYHPNAKWLVDHGLNPKKARCVELSNARRFLDWSHGQPWVILHEMAHAWHHQFVENSFNNKLIRSAHSAARASGRYDDVLRYSSRRQRHYALTTPQEYFAESTEAYFGTNDYYPFVRAELKQHDPDFVPVLERLWELPGK